MDLKERRTTLVLVRPILHAGRTYALKEFRDFGDHHPNVGPYLCVASLQYFLTQLVVALQWSPPYSISQNTISDLGNTVCGNFNDRHVCSPLHEVMNFSFMLLGATMVISCLLVHRLFSTERSRWVTLGFSLFAIGGVGVMLVGGIPENSVPLFHGVGAALPFIFGNIGIVLLGRYLAAPLAFRLFTLTSGLVALTALVFYATGSFLGLGEGGLERIVAYPQTVWLIGLGVFLLRGKFQIGGEVR